MAHDVFISYSSKDKPTADAVCNELESAGIRCWIAPRDILPGQQWGASIVQAIQGSKLMVLILSTNANASEQVLREVERSVHHAIPIIPFRIEEFELASAFEYFLSVPHWLDAMTGPLEEHIQRLVHITKVLLEERQGAAPAVPTHDLPVQRQAEPAGAVRPRGSQFEPSAPSVRTAPSPPMAGARPMAVPSAARAAPRAEAPTGERGRLSWKWGVPVALAVLVVGALAVMRLAPASLTNQSTLETTAGPATSQAATPGIPTAAPPATQPAPPPSSSVRVASSVEGATILVNGQPAGRTPQSLSLQPGQYQLTLQAATYRDWSEAIQVSEGEQLPVQAILDPLPPIDVLEVTERLMGRDAAVDSGRIVRIRAPTETFQVSDVVNAVIYFRPKTFQIRDISYNVTHRWQIAGEPEPGVVAGTSRGPRDEPLLFTHACALASQLDPRGSNTPLTLEVLVDGESVARFTFRISGGSVANAPQDPVQACDRTRLPTIVVTVPEPSAPADVL